MPLAVQRLIFIAFACAAGVALLGLLFYVSARFNHYDTTFTAHLLAPSGSLRESVAEFTSDGGNSGPLALGLLVTVGFGISWHRPWQLAAGVAVFLLANFSTQMMKLVLAHPRLQGALGASYPIEIGYPSGHTTGALSLGFAFWVTAPPRWRGWAALLAATYAAAVALGVIFAGWHFISDVIGAIFVVGFWAALALAALVLGGKESPGDWRLRL
ncbi:MAG: phosphatase PAP2 family protein [Solirubrobacterales bacterium]|nr:phosphatase PAP2 family protein [Solirubrobacterales bacterium]